jgi:hypothetical protein
VIGCVVVVFEVVVVIGTVVVVVVFEVVVVIGCVVVILEVVVDSMEEMDVVVDCDCVVSMVEMFNDVSEVVTFEDEKTVVVELVTQPPRKNKTPTNIHTNIIHRFIRYS